MSKATISAEEFDRLVDEGKEDVVQYFDLQNARLGPQVNTVRPTVQKLSFSSTSHGQHQKRPSTGFSDYFSSTIAV
jgi:hypothetical protein